MRDLTFEDLTFHESGVKELNIELQLIKEQRKWSVPIEILRWASTDNKSSIKFLILFGNEKYFWKFLNWAKK